MRLLAVVAALAHGGHTQGQAVEIGYDSFGPAQVAVLPGDAVAWSNASARRHSVNATDGTFASAILFPGDTYRRRFDVPGVIAYYCRLHPSMRAEIHVERLLLDTPRAAGAPGRPYTLSGRAALPAGTIVRIEREDAGGFVRVASATVDADGHFSASVVPSTSGRYRAATDDTATAPAFLPVVDHAVTAAAHRRGPRRVVVTAAVRPAAPGMDVVLQLRLRSRFGWWPVRHARLDDRSRARFVLGTRRAVRARVVLTLPDRATVLAASAVRRAGPGRRRPRGAHPGGRRRPPSRRA